MRIRLLPTELSATALVRSSLPTTSYTNAWRAGWLTAFNAPSMAASV